MCCRKLWPRGQGWLQVSEDDVIGQGGDEIPAGKVRVFGPTGNRGFIVKITLLQH